MQRLVLLAANWLAWILGADEGSFWGGMQSTVQFWHDIFNGTIVAPLFCADLYTWVAVYQGYACDPTPEGIGDR